MASVNKVIIIGNLGRDPELRYTPSGQAVCNVSLATTRKWKSKDGERKEETEWHRLVFFDHLAETAGKYLQKGGSVYVEGRLRTRKWQDKDGKDMYTTEIYADQMQLLGGKEPASEPTPQANNHSPKPQAAKPSLADMDDDIPF